MINTKTKGELGRRIEYDVEHDLFHPQNIYSDEYITPTFIEYVQELEKENASLKNALEGYKQIAKWCDKCDKIAELEAENQKWKDEWQEKVQEATDESYARTLQTIQLTTAIEIIKDLLSLCEGETDSKLVFTRAEQFLKENSTYERIQKAKYNYTD